MGPRYWLCAKADSLALGERFLQPEQRNWSVAERPGLTFSRQSGPRSLHSPENAQGRQSRGNRWGGELGILKLEARKSSPTAQIPGLADLETLPTAPFWIPS